MRSDRSIRTGRRAAGAAVTLIAVTALAACTSGSGGSDQGKAPIPGPGGAGTSSESTQAPQPPAPDSAPTSTPAIITTSAVHTKKINPGAPVSISIAHGTLTAVTMTNPAGKKVTGVLSADATSWHNTEDLGYSKTYVITARGKNAEGTPVTKRESVTTVTPNNQTAVSMDRTGDYALDNGATYGVALVPELYFDENISSPAAKAKVIKALTVTTSPHVAGAWAWQDNNRVLFRPEHYWPAHTKVTIAANIYGIDFGHGLYGQADEKRSFTIGRKQLTVTTDTAPTSVNKVRVYNAAGKVLRTMNTSMGEHRGVTENGQYINFYTLDGTYTVLEHDNPAYMSSESYGLPANSPDGYASEPIYNSTKISVDGIYLHELDTTVYNQDHGQDVSHGCLNLNQANAHWFYTHSMIGDPVVIHGAKGAPRIQVWQGGAWSVSWAKWKTGNLS